MCSRVIDVCTLGIIIISDSVAVPIAALDTSAVPLPAVTTTTSAVTVTTVPVSIACLAVKVTAAPVIDVENENYLFDPQYQLQ